MFVLLVTAAMGINAAAPPSASYSVYGDCLRKLLNFEEGIVGLENRVYASPESKVRANSERLKGVWYKAASDGVHLFSPSGSFFVSLKGEKPEAVQGTNNTRRYRFRLSLPGNTASNVRYDEMSSVSSKRLKVYGKLRVMPDEPCGDCTMRVVLPTWDIPTRDALRVVLVSGAMGLYSGMSALLDADDISRRRFQQLRSRLRHIVQRCEGIRDPLLRNDLRYLRLRRFR